MTSPNSQPSQGDNHHATRVTYAGQNEAELRAEYERERDANGPFGVLTTFDDYIRYKQQSAQYHQQQEQNLEQVVESYRPPMSPAGSFYMGYDHKALKSMVTENMDPASANEQGEAWTKIGNTLVDLQNNLTKATETSKGAWQGQAAEAAQGYFTSVAAWSGNAAQAAQLTGNKLYSQRTAAETAKNSMPEPVEFSTADAYKMFFSEPNPFKWAETIDKIEQKFEEKQQAHERAAEVMTTMSTSFQEAGSTMPAFAPPPPMQGTGGSGESVGTGTGEISGRPTMPSSVGTGTGTGTGTGADLSSSGSGFGSGFTGGSGTGGTGGNTNQSWTPGTGGGGTGGTGGGGGGGGGTGGGGGYPGPGGWVPPVPPGPGQGRPGPGTPTGRPPGLGGPGRGGPGGGGLPGGGRGGLGGAGGGGLGGPGGMAAAGGRGGFGPGGLGGAPGAGVLGDAGRSGAAGFGPTGSGPAGGFGPAGAGRGGPGGMAAGGMGGAPARGQGDEDKEHKSASYLVETEDVFGDGTMVAPPVIGG
ncbi:hypothetical protein JOF41_005792 [Saccharothrix coeruleofusca]|uniref:hypothetical protein n=1 Tax=Saccharothrix coeruleofusca TaxID=33919 RepID=UPI001AE4BB69|nr:hypothetical protein [Saccharothrix coeruleofusca]MBP2339614.1 hypothetical protein [Saccharothrix coeruleofusca]